MYKIAISDLTGSRTPYFRKKAVFTAGSTMIISLSSQQAGIILKRAAKALQAEHTTAFAGAMNDLEMLHFSGKAGTVGKFTAMITPGTPPIPSLHGLQKDTVAVIMENY